MNVMGKTAGTRLRTIIAIIAYVNMVLSQMDVVMFEGYPRLALAYKIVSAVFAGAAWTASHYFDENFTEASCKGTGLTRYLKMEASDKYYTEPISEEILEEVGDDE